jgi:hypothetical protein
VKQPQYAYVQGRTVIRIGHRYFAIPRPFDRVGAIHAKANLRGNWHRIEEQPRGSRLIVNQRR